MSSVLVSQGSTLNITPLFDQNCSFLSFRSIEKINGYMASMEVSVTTFEDIVSVLDEQEVTIGTQDGLSMKCQAYVYALDYQNSILTVRMFPVSADFMRNIYTTKFQGMDNIIKIYPGEVDNSSQSSIDNTIDLYQKSESNYSFMTKMLKSYRSGTIFAYTLSGLILREVDNYEAVEEVSSKGTSIVEGSEVHIISDPKRYSSEFEILDEFTYHKKIRIHDEVYDVYNDYEQLINNLVYFERFNSFKSEYKFKTKGILGANLCEGIDYTDESVSVINTIVSEREIYITNASIEVTYTIKSIEPLS